MNLQDYLSSGETTQSQLARALDVSPVLVHQWKIGPPRGRQVPAERCPEIEKATHGAVRCEDLRPDIDWAYLRGTSPSGGSSNTPHPQCKLEA